MRKINNTSNVEYLTVYTDVCNPTDSCFWPGDPKYIGKRWVDFTVPTRWLTEFLGVQTANDVSLMLASCSVDKEAVLIAAINDGVVSYGW